MFLFQRQSESIDDGSKDFKKLRDAVKALCLVNELEKDVVDRSANK